MDENRTLKGFWWSPDNPEQKWFGILAQTPKSIELICHSEINYTHPNAIQHDVRDGLSIELAIDYKYSVVTHAQSIHEDSYIRITKRDGLSFDVAWGLGSALRSLLHFAALRPVYLVSMQFHNCSLVVRPSPGWHYASGIPIQCALTGIVSAEFGCHIACRQIIENRQIAGRAR